MSQLIPTDGDNPTQRSIDIDIPDRGVLKIESQKQWVNSFCSVPCAQVTH
ncbi:hypothetical protein [Xenorhabdus entomophaga]